MYGALLAGLVVPLLLGFTPPALGSSRWVARPFGGHWLAEAVLGGLVILVLVALVTLPFAAWRHTVLRATGCPPRAGAGGRSTCSRRTRSAR